MSINSRTLLYSIFAFVIITSRVVAQDGSSRFQTADVRTSNPSDPSPMRGGFLSGGRCEFHHVSLIDLIRAAYLVDAEAIVGGPDWLDNDHFDVTAQGSIDASPESLNLMLQNLLSARFGLALHKTMKPFSAYALVVSGTLQLESSKDSGGGCKLIPQGTSDALSVGSDDLNLVCTGVTVKEFAEQLPEMADDYFQGNALVDRTMLKGFWNFRMQWTPRSRLTSSEVGSTSLFDVIRKLGIKVEIQSVPKPVLMVEHVNRLLPTAQPEAVPDLISMGKSFELAAIRLSAPRSPHRQLRMDRSGQVSFVSFSLRELIKFAWNLQDLDVIDNDEMLVDGPTSSTRFDVTAKIAGSDIAFGFSPDRHPDILSPEPELESVRWMLRTLLRERFKLEVHNESKAVPAYALVAINPKLQKANPDDRPGCRNDLVPPVRSNISERLFSISCRNISMAQLAERLQPMGGIYIPHPVVDSTGLKGGWNFNLTWSPPHLVQRRSGTSVEAVPRPSSNGGITMVEAVEKQLGLKLKLRKQVIPVLVVDRVLNQPTDN